MAKKLKSSVIRLVSMAGTGFFYTRRRTIKANQEKCALAPRKAPATSPPFAQLRQHIVCYAASRVCMRERRLKMLKYDPRVNAHVLFEEKKIKK